MGEHGQYCRNHQARRIPQIVQYGQFIQQFVRQFWHKNYSKLDKFLKEHVRQCVVHDGHLF